MAGQTTQQPGGNQLVEGTGYTLLFQARSDPRTKAVFVKQGRIPEITKEAYVFTHRLGLDGVEDLLFPVRQINGVLTHSNGVVVIPRTSIVSFEYTLEGTINDPKGNKHRTERLDLLSKAGIYKWQKKNRK